MWFFQLREGISLCKRGGRLPKLFSQYVLIKASQKLIYEFCEKNLILCSLWLYEMFWDSRDPDTDLFDPGCQTSWEMLVGTEIMQEFLSPFNAARSWNKQCVDHALSHRSVSFVLLCERHATWPQLPSTVWLRICILATRGLQLATAATYYSGHIPVLAGIYSHILQTNWKHL